MNKMEDVAKLLGLELGQFFMIDSDVFETSIFYLEANGLHIIDIGTEEFFRGGKRMSKQKPR